MAASSEFENGSYFNFGLVTRVSRPSSTDARFKADSARVRHCPVLRRQGTFIYSMCDFLLLLTLTFQTAGSFSLTGFQGGQTRNDKRWPLRGHFESRFVRLLSTIPWHSTRQS